MDINLVDTKILIKSENFVKIIESFREKFSDYEDVKTEDINTIDDVFWEFGYNIIQNENGDIIDLDTVSSDLPDGQEEFFAAIAQYVETDSHIEMKREDEYWKYVFEKGKMHRLDGEIVYHESGMTYDRAICLINEIIEHLCDVKRIGEVIEELLRIGFTDDELVDVFNFDANDVNGIVSSIEEAE